MSAGAGARNLRGMVPASFAGANLTGITRGGTPISYSTETIKGVEYAVFPAEGANYEALYGPDATPPVITDLGADPGALSLPDTAAQVTDTLADHGVTPDAVQDWADHTTWDHGHVDDNHNQVDHAGFDLF